MIIIIVLIILGLISVILIYLFIDPTLPSGTEQIIKEITSKEIPELITGTTGYAKSNSISIWYETKSNTSNVKGAVLLISGFTSPSTFWHQNFVQSIVDSGYQVIRFDNRSVGLSDWMKNWNKSYPYTREDMVNDAIAVLDQNNIDKAHIVGYSMGGNIGQRLAIEYPERVLSLTSLSSTAAHVTDHQKFIWAPLPLKKLFLRSRIIPSDSNQLKFLFLFFTHMNGKNSYPLELKLLGERGLYELHKRRGFNIFAGKHHMTAIKTSKSNHVHLAKIIVPTLVAHGENDPVLSIELAKIYANELVNSKQIWIEKTGHVMTDFYIQKILPYFLKIIEEANKDKYDNGAD